MNKILAAITCPNCSKVLSTPILLPCGHSLCQEHVKQNEKNLVCRECGKSHVNHGFLVNKPLMDMITAQIESIDFGSVHQEAKNSCDRLDETLRKAESILNDLGYFIHETIAELKQQVNLKREEYKLSIDEAAQKVIDELEEFEKQCIVNLDEADFVTRRDEFKQLKDSARENLVNWYAFLNELKYNEKQCNQTHEGSNLCFQKFHKKLESFKKSVLMAKLLNKKACVDYFCQTNIRIKTKPICVQVDSTILNEDLKEKLSILLDYDRVVCLKLLYRGSRDGFKAKDFHSKCDELSATITVIKSTNGYVFGGYTAALWNDKSSSVGSDSNAFIFSLVNQHSHPLRMRVSDGNKAIYRDATKGPIFGDGVNCDIRISDQCDVNSNSSSLGRQYKLEGIFSSNESISETVSFIVQDLEVFQVV